MSVYWPEARAARKGPLAIRGRRGRSRGPTRRLAPSASSSPRSRREPCNHIRAISRPTPSLLRRGNQSPPLCLGKSHPQPLDFQSMGKSDDGTAITSATRGVDSALIKLISRPSFLPQTSIVGTPCWRIGRTWSITLVPSNRRLRTHAQNFADRRRRIFSSRAIARTPNPLFFKSPTALEYAFNVAGRPNLTPRFIAAARPALTRSRIIPRSNSATAISKPS